MSKKPLHILVDPELLKALKMKALLADTNMTVMVTKLLEQHMSRGDTVGGLLTLDKPLREEPSDLVKPSNGLTQSEPAPAHEPVTSVVQDRTPYKQIQAIYNDIANGESKEDGLPGFKVCKRLDLARKRGIQRLVKELGNWNKDSFEITPSEYFKRCCRSRHWRGDNDRGWRADIEFLTRDKQISAAFELEEVDVVVQTNGDGAGPELTYENVKARIRAFLDSDTVSADDETQFLSELESTLRGAGAGYRKAEMLDYYKRYAEYANTKPASVPDPRGQDNETL
jgi:hypothetical protein